jgi:hypothetical protein
MSHVGCGDVPEAAEMPVQVYQRWGSLALVRKTGVAAWCSAYLLVGSPTLFALVTPDV